MFYSNLSQNQVTSTYTLFKFLERLRVIGHIQAHTEQMTSGFLIGNFELHALTHCSYAIVKDGYESDNRYMEVLLEFEELFGRYSVDSAYVQREN